MMVTVPPAAVLSAGAVPLVLARHPGAAEVVHQIRRAPAYMHQRLLQYTPSQAARQRRCPGRAGAPASSLQLAFCPGPSCRMTIAHCMPSAWRNLACRCKCPGAEVLSHAHALLPPRRCSRPLCACVSVRTRCRWCALCVRARARSSGLWSVARTCQRPTVRRGSALAGDAAVHVSCEPCRSMPVSLQAPAMRQPGRRSGCGQRRPRRASR
mmetsp:Transcript_10340/g.26666  ORF Transcript_10340/g.26666 Transcript_10340/m.26666 type:complete len:211 (+) Transcript_10340:222-854(+)